MKNTLLAGALLAIGAWTAGASAQPQPVTVTLVDNQIPDVAPIVVERQHGAQCPSFDGSCRQTRTTRSIRLASSSTGRRQAGGGLRAAGSTADLRAIGGPKHVTCLNQNTKRGEFKYTIRLLDRGRNLVERDPLIVNR